MRAYIFANDAFASVVGGHYVDQVETKSEAEGERTEMSRKTAQEAAHWYGRSESTWGQMKGGREMCEGQKHEVVPPFEFSIY